MQTYDVILADPPWRYDFSKASNRKIENQYPTLALSEIQELPVKALTNPAGAVLFLWATLPKLPEALSVMSAWGFTYKTLDVWDKQKIGMGYYWRTRHELLLLGTLGKPGTPAPSNRPFGGIYEPRSKHSKKPTSSYERIERMYPNARKLELFARQRRPGWDVWGNEVESLITLNG